MQAATLTYVRTEDGVVQLVPGAAVPNNALPKDVDRLARAGSVVEVEEPKAPVKPPKGSAT